MDLTSVSQFDSCYADFKALAPTPAEELKKKLKEKDINEEKQKVIKEWKLENIQSDYLSMTTYYYNKQTNMIFGFDNNSAIPHPPESKEIDKHLRDINKLPLESPLAQ